jgi:hypothetical protein
MEDKKPLGFLKDNSGDNSSKRLAAFILLALFIVVSVYGVIVDSVIGAKSIEFIKYISTISLGGVLTLLGFTLPEVLSKK